MRDRRRRQHLGDLRGIVDQNEPDTLTLQEYRRLETDRDRRRRIDEAFAALRNAWASDPAPELSRGNHPRR